MSASNEESSSGAESAAPAPLRIRAASDLHAALFAPDPRTRLQVLKGIAGQPSQALAFGLHEGRDVIDALLERAARTAGRPEWQAVVAALCAFRDHRATAFLVDVLGTAQDADALFLAAHGLGGVDLAPLSDGLQPMLLQNDCVARARAVARVLARDPSAGVAARVRLALLADTDEPEAPPLEDGSMAAWLAELSGLFHREARAELELQGHAAFTHLGRQWRELSPDSQAWLVGWGIRDFADSAQSLVEKALGSSSDRVLLATLHAIASSETRAGAPCEWSARLREPLVHLVDHPLPALRLAAIVALGHVPSLPGASTDRDGIDWRDRIAREADPAVRRACAERLAVSEGTGAIDDLLGLLRDADWRPRAVAVDALIGLGEAVLPRVEPLLEDADPAVRIGAAKILLSLSPERSDLEAPDPPA